MEIHEYFQWRHPISICSYIWVICFARLLLVQEVFHASPSNHSMRSNVYKIFRSSLTLWRFLLEPLSSLKLPSKVFASSYNYPTPSRFPFLAPKKCIWILYENAYRPLKSTGIWKSMPTRLQKDSTLSHVVVVKEDEVNGWFLRPVQCPQECRDSALTRSDHTHCNPLSYIHRHFRESVRSLL